MENRNNVNPFRRNLSKTSESMHNSTVQKNINDNPFFENDEESEALAKRSDDMFDKFSSKREDKVKLMLEKEASRLDKKYPGGGIKKQRIITYDILQEASPDYFDKYLKDAVFYSSIIRTRLAENEKSEIIAKAQTNPVDDAMQERAFGVVNSLALDVIGEYRGIDRKILLCMIINEILGFSVLDPLWRCKKIDEIICNGPFDVQVEVRGKLYKVPSCKFESVDHMETLLLKLYEAVGKVYSPMTPLIKGRLHDNSRIYAVHPVVAPDGPNFNIRKHPESFWTPKDLVERKSASKELMTDLGNLIYNGASFLVIGGVSTGKAEILSTPIPTPSGWTTIGEINPGDKVFDHKGNSSTVKAIHPQPERDVYAVKFSNNQISYVSKDHNWFVHDSSEKTIKSRIVETKDKVLSTPLASNVKDFYDTQANKIFKKTAREKFRKNLTNFKGSAQSFYISMFNNFNLPIPSLISSKFKVMTTDDLINAGIKNEDGFKFKVPLLETPVIYEDEKTLKELPIHPYILGIWLGCGNARAGSISCSEDKVKFFNSFLREEIFTPLKQKNKWKVNVPDFTANLKNLGIFQKTTAEGIKKAIPIEYKTASLEVRRMLTAGLFDSIGSIVTGNGNWRLTVNLKSLIIDCVQVAASLGYKVVVDPTLEFDENSKNEWFIEIPTYTPLGFLPSLVKEAEENFVEDEDLKQGMLSIVDVYKIYNRKERMVCLTVDSEDNTYMSENSFITTHNTSMLNALTGFLKEDVRLITIEDNIEMKPNPKKFKAAAMETRPARPDKKEDINVSIRDLVRAATQMRPDSIIVGEVTGPEALDLVNALNTGQYGAATVHANSEEEGLYRLSSLMGQTGEVVGDGALPLIASAFDIFIYLEHFPIDGSRRIMSISEVASRPRRDANGNLELPLNPLWKFETKGINADGVVVGEYVKVGEISEERRRRRHLDLMAPLTWDDLVKLSDIPEEFKENKKK